MDQTTACCQIAPNLWVDVNQGVITREETTIALTRVEMELLSRLIQAQGHYLRSAYLIEELQIAGKRSLESLIYKIRQKLGDSGRHPRFLLGKYAVGYGFFPCSEKGVRPLSIR